MGLVWDYYPAGGGEMLTMLKLADHADHDGSRVWPSVKRTADLTRQSERTIQRQLQAIIKNGWLEVVKQGGKGAADTTIYRVPIERIPHDVVARVPDCHPSKLSTRVTPDVNKGDIQRNKGDTAMSPESSCKPIVSKRQALSKLNGKGKHQPVWKRTDGELEALAKQLGIHSRGLLRDQLIRAIEAKLQ